MGRRKIEIKKLENARNRNATFKKRRQGILKKAHELAVLTDSKVTLSIQKEDALENHVFNDELPAIPVAPTPPAVVHTAPVTHRDMSETPLLDDDRAIEDTIVARAPAEQALSWPFDPMDMDFDQNLESIFQPLDLGIMKQFGEYDLDFNDCASSLGLFGNPLLADLPNDPFLNIESHDASNWLAPLLEYNAGPARPAVG